MQNNRSFLFGLKIWQNGINELKPLFQTIKKTLKLNYYHKDKDSY